MDRRLLLLPLVLGASACCCDPPFVRELVDDPGARARGAPAQATVTVRRFALELHLPPGSSAQQLAEAEERALEREAAELALKVTERKVELGLIEVPTLSAPRRISLTEEGFRRWEREGGRILADAGIERETIHSYRDGREVTEHRYTFTAQTELGRREERGRPREEAERYWRPVLERQRAALAALPAAAPLPAESERPLELRERWRFVTLGERLPLLEEGGFHSRTRRGHVCGTCIARAERGGGIFVRSYGEPGLDLGAVPAEELAAGVALEAGRVSFGGADWSEPTVLEKPAGAKLVLRLEASCTAKLTRVEERVVVGTGSGVIAIPEREDQFWHELRDVGCAPRLATEHQVFGAPAAPRGRAGVVSSSPTRFWIKQHRAELERLERLERPETR